MQQIVAATNNPGKLKEFQEIIKNYEIISLKDINCQIEVEEDKDTFEENALKKAIEVTKLTNRPCIADDSGLCIDALNGLPGVKTARFLGINKTQEERNNYLIEQLKGLEKQKRTAQVITCIAFVKPGKKQQVFMGKLTGYIAQSKKGNNGFGFDEIFELENGKTIAELTSQEKNRISSRSIALNKLKKYLEEK